MLNVKQYGNPVGALAIATAVVCGLYFGSHYFLLIFLAGSSNVVSS